MRLIGDEFEEGALLAFGVNDGESVAVVQDFMNDVGGGFSVLLDAPWQPSCWKVPGDEMSLATYFRNRVGQTNEAPFPLQIVIGADGKLAYMSRRHGPDGLMSVLHAEVKKARELYPPIDPPEPPDQERKPWDPPPVPDVSDPAGSSESETESQPESSGCQIQHHSQGRSPSSVVFLLLLACGLIVFERWRSDPLSRR